MNKSSKNDIKPLGSLSIPTVTCYNTRSLKNEIYL